MFLYTHTHTRVHIGGEIPSCSHTVEYDQYQHATELGEKYEDFHILVHLCEALENKAKLQEYMTRFAGQGFSDFLFKQYLNEGKMKKLLSFSEDFPRELSAFLKPHDSLSWLHHTATKEYGKVCVLEHTDSINFSDFFFRRTKLSREWLAMK